MENKQTTLPELLEIVAEVDQRAAIALNQWLIKRLSDVKQNRDNNPAWILNDHADRVLLTYTERAMGLRLSAARSQGRAGWWDKDICTIETLRGLLYKATLDDDLISVMNYAAMITARNIIDKH